MGIAGRSARATGRGRGNAALLLNREKKILVTYSLLNNVQSFNFSVQILKEMYAEADDAFAPETDDVLVALAVHVFEKMV